MKILRSRAAALAFLGAIAAGSSVANAQSVEDFYQGKTLELVVSSAAGTATDFLARQFAEFFPRHVPGQPDIVVMNVPGAGGMVAASQLQNTANKDGTVIGFLQRNNLYRPLVEDNHDTFDPREVNWIGSLNREYYALVAWKTSPAQTAEEVFEETMILGATGFANENRTLPALMNEYLGAKFDIVSGYKGRGEVHLAMQRGEVDGWLATLNGLRTGEESEFLKQGNLKVLMQLRWQNHPDVADVPNFSTFASDADPETKNLIDFFVLPFEAGRPIAVPGGVPEDRVAALRQAFDDTMADSDFVAHMESVNSPVDPVPGEAVDEVRDKLYATPESVLENARGILVPQN